MLNWFRKKTLEDHINKDGRKKVKIMGIIFTIRKINPLDYLDGSTAIKQIYETYQVNQAVSPTMTEGTIKKIKKHYIDVICASVIDPKISRVDEPGAMYVENLFTDWELIEMLYTAIMAFTHGKKKINQHL